MKPVVCGALAFLLQLLPSCSFVASPWVLLRSCPAATESPTKLLRDQPRGRDRELAHQHRAGNSGDGWEGLLELDVVEYREDGADTVELGSYIGNGKVQPLLTREESGPQLFFHDEDAQPLSVNGDSCRIVRVLDQVYFSQRIVEDRRKNPHGEEAEDCFLVEGQLSPSVVIRVEHDP